MCVSQAVQWSTFLCCQARRRQNRFPRTFAVYVCIAFILLCSEAVSVLSSPTEPQWSPATDTSPTRTAGGSTDHDSRTSHELASQYAFEPRAVSLFLYENGALSAHDIGSGKHYWTTSTGAPAIRVTYDLAPSNDSIRKDPLALPFTVRGNSLFTHAPITRSLVEEDSIEISSAEPSSEAQTEGLETPGSEDAPLYFFAHVSTLLRRQTAVVNGVDLYVTSSAAIMDFDSFTGQCLHRIDPSEGPRRHHSADANGEVSQGESTTSTMSRNPFVPMLHIVRYDICIHAYKVGEYSWTLTLSQYRFSERSPARAAASSSDEQKPRFFSQVVQGMDTYENGNKNEKMPTSRRGGSSTGDVVPLSIEDNQQEDMRELLASSFFFAECNTTHVALWSVRDHTILWAAGMSANTSTFADNSTADHNENSRVVATYVWLARGSTQRPSEGAFRSAFPTSSVDPIVRLPFFRSVRDTMADSESVISGWKRDRAAHQREHRRSSRLPLVKRSTEGHVVPYVYDSWAIDAEAEEEEGQQLENFYATRRRRQWWDPAAAVLGVQYIGSKNSFGDGVFVIPMRGSTSWTVIVTVGMHCICLALSIAFLCAGVPQRGRLQRAWAQADRSRDLRTTAPGVMATTGAGPPSRPLSASLHPQDLISPSLRPRHRSATGVSFDSDADGSARSVRSIHPPLSPATRQSTLPSSLPSSALSHVPPKPSPWLGPLLTHDTLLPTATDGAVLPSAMLRQADAGHQKQSESLPETAPTTTSSASLTAGTALEATLPQMSLPAVVGSATSAGNEHVDSAKGSIGTATVSPAHPPATSASTTLTPFESTRSGTSGSANTAPAHAAASPPEVGSPVTDEEVPVAGETVPGSPAAVATTTQWWLRRHLVDSSSSSSTSGKVHDAEANLREESDSSSADATRDVENREERRSQRGKTNEDRGKRDTRPNSRDDGESSESSHSSTEGMTSRPRNPRHRHSEASMTPYDGRLFQQHFRIIKRVGCGAEGSVFCVEHRWMHTTYAIKVVHIHSMEQDKVVQEAVLHSSFDNPNVVRFFFCWVEDVPAAEVEALQLLDHDDDMDAMSVSYCSDDVGGSSNVSRRRLAESDDPSWRSQTSSPGLVPESYRMLFIQMEFFPRGTLADELKARKRVSRKVNLQYIKDIAEGLSYLHSAQNVVHRDLKPTNVFVSESGVLKIGDFGLAKRRGPVAPSASGGALSVMSSAGVSTGNSAVDLSSNVLGGQQDQSIVGGSPLYCSPEQTHGDVANKPTDVFSLGIIAVEMYCTFTTMHERIRVLSEAREQVLPDELGEGSGAAEDGKIFLEMLRPEPARRPLIRHVIRSINRLLEEMQKVKPSGKDDDAHALAQSQKKDTVANLASTQGSESSLTHASGGGQPLRREPGPLHADSSTATEGNNEVETNEPI